MTKHDAADAPAPPGLWQIGLAAFNQDPNQPGIAMQNIWDAMLPPGNLNLVAQIVGALFGDHYFNGAQMDAGLLAQELQAALGKSAHDCQTAAHAAFSQWCGLLVRSNFGDHGQIPRRGNLCTSPDVIVNGHVATTPSRLITKWDQPDWQPASGKNYTYGRAASMNLGVPITKPQLRMYVTNAGLNNPPNQWTRLFTAADAGTSPLVNVAGQSTLQPGDRSANSDAFFSDLDGSTHYCMIAAAGTEFFTNDPSTVPPGNWSSALWIQCNGAAGWHNLDVPRSTTTSLKIHNQDGTRERFEIEAHCSALPIGTEVSLRAADAGLASRVDSGQVQITAAHQIVRADAELPAHYQGDLVVQFQIPGGGLLPATASIEVRMYWQLPAGHRHYLDAVNLVGDATAVALSRPARVFVGAFTLAGRA